MGHSARNLEFQGLEEPPSPEGHSGPLVPWKRDSPPTGRGPPAPGGGRHPHGGSLETGPGWPQSETVLPGPKPSVASTLQSRPVSLSRRRETARFRGFSASPIFGAPRLQSSICFSPVHTFSVDSVIRPSTGPGKKAFPPPRSRGSSRGWREKENSMSTQWGVISPPAEQGHPVSPPRRRLPCPPR